MDDTNKMGIGKFIKAMESDARECGETMTDFEAMALEVLDDCHGDERHSYDGWFSLYHSIQNAG